MTTHAIRSARIPATLLVSTLILLEPRAVAVAPQAAAPADPPNAPRLQDDGIRVGDVIDPAAAAILDRAAEVLLAMRTFEAVTQIKGKAFFEELPPGTDVGPARVTLRFRTKDAVSMPLMRVETLGAGGDAAPTRIGAFDGGASIVIDMAGRQFHAARGFGALTLAEFSALPRWAIEARTRAALSAAKREGAMRMSKRVAARVVGTETVDGEECDLVASVLVLDAVVSDPSSADGAVEQPKAVRMIETVAFARKDGLPRRIVTASENPGEGPNGAVELTATYSQVRFDASVDDAAFTPKPPEGFTAAAVVIPAKPQDSVVIEAIPEPPLQAPPGDPKPESPKPRIPTPESPRPPSAPAVPPAKP